MKKFLLTPLLLALILLFSCGKKTSHDELSYETKTVEENGYSYSYVTNDPLKARIYTLDNGLKVYMSVNKQAPRIYTNIAVNAGGKNDPATATGLAHYLEHMLFKGTTKYGTQNWEVEKPLLDSIEALYETYRTLEDPAARKAHYKIIDDVSQEAAQYAIANEYDKMVGLIGAKGTNAYTSEDRTVYLNDIPANELDRWIQIEADRFVELTPRLFHTELEAVYEEKNRGLDSDYRRVYEELYKLLFPGHPYGTQTVIGTIDHLKNPSITEIKKYFNRYYVPNNMAVCISGDFDPDEAIKKIDAAFGGWEKTGNPHKAVAEADPITETQEAEVFGPESERVMIAFRFPEKTSDDALMMEMVDMILSNREAGLMDLNLKQAQKVLSAGTYPDLMNDYSAHMLYGEPREGQSLEEVKDLLLGELEKVKKGEFDDWLIEAVINDLKISRIRRNENNYGRVGAFVEYFNAGDDWMNYVNKLDRMDKITKEEVVEFAKNNYNEHVIVYKREGEKQDIKKVDKPEITEVPVNRDAKSDFLNELESQKPEALKPVFIDFEKAMSQQEMQKGIEVFHIPNEENDLFELYYRLDLGSNQDPKISLAVNYLEYLGTEEMSAVDFKKEMYKLGCSMRVYAGQERSSVILTGLEENRAEALKLLEALLANPKADKDAYDKMVDGIMKERTDAKKSKGNILYSGLMNYAIYGANSPFTSKLSNEELKNLDPSELTAILKGLTSYEHRVCYYGPASPSELTSSLKEIRNLPEEMQAIPEPQAFPELATDKPAVYWAHYDMVQAEIMFISKEGDFDKTTIPKAGLFNEYFGGGMGSILFQEMRESRALAYSVWGRYRNASRTDKADYITAYIGTQADKLPEAMAGMMDLMRNMPESELAFQLAKDAIKSKIESERFTKSSPYFSYERAMDKELDYDIRKDVYEAAKNMTLEDLKAFHESSIKDNDYVVVVLGDRTKLNFNALKKYGELKELSLEELFGY